MIAFAGREGRAVAERQRGADRDVGDGDAECLGAVGVCLHRRDGQRNGSVFTASGGGDIEIGRVGDRVDGDGQTLGDRVGVRPIGRGRGDREVEVGVAVRRRLNGQTFKQSGVGVDTVDGDALIAFAGREGRAVAERQRGADRDVGDGDAECLGAVGVCLHRRDGQRNGSVFTASGGGDIEIGRIGDRVDGDL